MASIVKHIETDAPVDAVWSAIRDVGALHTRLVPGFVTDTVLDGDARIVTFANGLVLREVIVTIDDAHRRLVWAGESESVRHHNGAAQAIERAGGGTVVVWTADFTPDELTDTFETMMTAGAAAMKAALDRHAAVAW